MVTSHYSSMEGDTRWYYSFILNTRFCFETHHNGTDNLLDQCHDNFGWCLCCNFLASYGRGFSLAIHSTMAYQCHSLCMTKLEFLNNPQKCFCYQKCKKFPDGTPVLDHWLWMEVINIIICFSCKLMEGDLQKKLFAILFWPLMWHKLRAFSTLGTG